MVGSSKKFIYILLFVFLLIAPFVAAQDFLEPILRPFKGTNIAQTYTNYAAFIDAILYFWLFLGLSKSVLGEKFSNSKAVPTAMGIILAIGMCVFELQSGFNIGKLAPIAALIFFILLGTALYNWFKNVFGEGAGMTWIAFSLAFLILFGVINWAAPSFITWAYQMDWVSTIFSIAFIAAIIGLIYGVIQLFGGIKGGGLSFNWAKRKNDNAEKTYNTSQDKNMIASRRERKAAENVANLEREMQNLNRDIVQAAGLEKQMYDRILTNRTEQQKTIAELQVLLTGASKYQDAIIQANNNINNASYANNPQFASLLQDSSAKLSEHVSRINSMLLKLQTGMKQTVDEQVKEEQAEQIISDKINDLEKTIVRYEDSIVDINNQMQTLDPLDVKNKEILDALNTLIAERKQTYIELKNNTEALKVLRAQIKKDDEDNLKDIEHAVTVSSQNPLKDLGVFSRGLNAASNYTGRPQTTNPAIMPGVINAAKDVLNVWYKYISSGSLREIQQSVTNINTRLNTYLGKYYNEEKAAIIKRNELYKKVATEHVNTKKINDQALGNQVNLMRQKTQENVRYFKDFSDHLGVWISLMVKMRGMTVKEKYELWNTQQAHSNAINTEKRLWEQLDKYDDYFRLLKDKDTRDILIAKRNFVHKLVRDFMESRKIMQMGALTIQEEQIQNTKNSIDKHITESMRRMKELEDQIKLELAVANINPAKP